MFERHAAPFIHERADVLEIGPDTIPSTYRCHTPAAIASWHTLDFERNEPLTYTIEDGYSFPIEDDSYDVVISGQVIEHVPKPWRWLPEVARVTRRGGTVITVAPVTWPYHEAPVDCWRVYPDGLRALYDEAGLDVVLAEWGSIELEAIVRRLPKRIPHPQLQLQRLSTALLLLSEHTRWKNQGSYDTVAVGRKR